MHKQHSVTGKYSHRIHRRKPQTYMRPPHALVVVSLCNRYKGRAQRAG
jgi:hypothetical protein